MKIYVMCDLEGICGINSPDQLGIDKPKYAEGRALLTREMNNVARYLKEAGVDEVIMHDAHGSGANVIWKELSSDIDACVTGAVPTRFFEEYVKDCDGVILLGYHAMAGTAGALLEHTMTSAGIQNVWLNDEKVGEVAIDAGILGDMGIPVIMVSGDDKVCLEAGKILPWAELACVKHSASTFCTALLTPERSAAVLKKAIHNAISRISEMKPYKLSKPVKCKIEVVERSPIPRSSNRASIEYEDGRTCVVVADTVFDAFYGAR